jgi:hypothetical protein
MPRRRCGSVHRRVQRQMDRPSQQMQAAISRPVSLVSQNRRPQNCTMNPDLMGPPCPRPHLQPGPLRRSAQHTPIGDRVLAPGGIDHHPPALWTGRPPQRRTDGTGITGHSASHHRPVDFPHLPGCKQRLRRDQRRPPQRDHQAAGGIRIQPVHQPRPILPPRQQRKPVLNAPSPGRASMHRQPRRFIQDDEAPVLEQDGGSGTGHPQPVADQTAQRLERDPAERNAFERVNHAIKQRDRAFSARTIRLKML